MGQVLRLREAERSVHIVERGDALWEIARAYGVSVAELRVINDLTSDRIYPGQVLRLQASPRPRVPPVAASTPPRSAKSNRPDPAAEQAPKAPPTRAAKTPVQGTPEPSPAARRLAWRWPASGRVASTFNPSDPLRKGIKIAGRDGADIVAAERGKVVYSGSGLIGYGRLIIVKHNDNYLSAYGHNRELLVSEGDQVIKGQKIAAMGQANDGQPLLHFEIRRDGKPVDPLRLLPRR